MRYFLDTNILIFHAFDNDNLDKNVISILDNYENLIYEAITNKMPLISSDGQFRHYKGQGLNLVFNNVHEKNRIAK
jgi:PIN domain nuclease of toxin-antitoxin system